MPKYLDSAGLSHFWESIKPKLGGVKQSGSGTVITSDDAANLPPLSLTIHGLSVQDGTPSPSNPVPIRSVESTNLIDSTNIINAYFTAAGGIVANSGNRVIWMPCCPNTLYGVAKTMREDGKDRFYIAYTTEQPANGVAVYGVKNIQGSDSTTYAGKRIQRSITTGADARFLVIWAGQATFDDSYSKTQVCNGFAFYPYREYGEIAVRSCGKNLSDTPMLGVYDQSAKYFAENNKTYATSTLFKADGAEQFTVSTDFTFGQALIYCWEDDGSYIGFNSSGSAGRKSATLTTLNGTALAAITIRNADTSQDIDLDDLTSYQVEKGSTATAYEPYSSTTTPIPVTLRSLPDGTHDEWISGETEDTLVQRVGVQVFDGSVYVPWISGSGTYTRFGITFNGLASSTVMCEQLTERATLNLVAANAYSICGTTDNRLYFSLSQTETTAADATAALAAHPITVYYKLATPVTTTLPHVGLPSLPSPSFSMHVDAAVTPTLDAEWWTQVVGKVIEAVSTRITALESEVDALQADVTELQGQIPEREVLYDTSTWTVIRYGRTVMVQMHGATATAGASTALLDVLSSYKPSYNASTTVADSSGSARFARLWVSATDGKVYLAAAGYTTSAVWYGTLTYIY